MADFSIGEAFTAGFRIIGRRPGAVFAWSLVFFVCIALPISLLLGSFIPAMIQFSQAAQTQASMDGPSEMPDGFFSLWLRMMAIQPISLLAQFVVLPVLMSAVIRAVLEPDQSSYGYLRLGGRELWVMLVSFVMRFLIGVCALVLIVPILFSVAGSIAVGYQHHNILQPGAFAGFFAAIFVVIILVLWLSLKLSMAVPMSWDQSQFRLFESWGFTRGHVSKLLMLGFLQFLLGLALECVVLFGLFAIGASVYASHGGVAGLDHDQLAAWFTQAHPALGLPVTAIAVGAAYLLSLLAAVGQAVFYAPWVDAYRQLRASSPQSPVYAHAPGEAPILPPSAAV